MVQTSWTSPQDPNDGALEDHNLEENVPCNQNNNEEVALTKHGVMGAKSVLAPYEYDVSNPEYRISLFARAPCFDTVALDRELFCVRYATVGYLP